MKAVHADIAELEQRAAKEEKQWRRRQTEKQIQTLRGKLPQVRESLFPRLAKSDKALATDWQAVQRFRATRDQRALEVGRIHRDYFGSSLFRLPSEANTAQALTQLAALGGDDAETIGTLRWTFTPTQVNIAGWRYSGWKHHFQLTLTGERTTRYFRETGTWELGGRAVGATIVALRYRGLGGVDETFGQSHDGAIDRNFTTTETIPGAAGGAPLISPIVPPGDDNRDRGFGIRHRVSPWIGRMVRGAGSAMFEFQHRPEGLFVSFPDRLADLRAVTEAFTGDTAISQTNEEYFGRTNKLKTTPMYYLALAAPKGETFAAHERNTRWQEVDQYTRRRVSDELGFVQAEPLPGVGLNLDTAWEPRLKTLTERMDQYADLGMRMILVHQPGWMNGRGLRESKIERFVQMAKAGGGDCSIYDYIPRPTVEAEWKALTRKLAEHEVAYLVWSSYFSVGPGPFIQELLGEHDLTEANFAGYENPDAMDRDENFFERGRIPHNPLDPTVLNAYVERIDQAAEKYGHHGIWADSWHKWGLLVTNDERRAPIYRAWMEQYAKWSRNGMAFVSEGQGCPIMSCSIELSEQKFEDEWWFLPHTTLWYRGKALPPGSGTAEADRHVFRLMANKCWTFAETGWGQDVLEIIPDFRRLAHEYNAALPLMRRSYILPRGKGVLWLGYKGDTKGVLFPFENTGLPPGVAAASILDDAKADSAQAYRTYGVEAKDLLKAFGLRRGTERDPRLDWTYRPMQYTWPDWAKNAKQD